MMMMMMNALAGTRGVCLSPTTTVQVPAQGDVALHHNSLRGLLKGGLAIPEVGIMQCL